MFVENQFITHSVSFNGELVNEYIYLSNAYYIAGATIAQHESANPSDLVLAHNDSDSFSTCAHSSNKGPQKSMSVCGGHKLLTSIFHNKWIP